MKKLTALFLFFLSFSAIAAIDAFNFASEEQEKTYHSLTQELRCPQCQNNNIADSNATIAVDMRAKVFELLQEGKTREDVVNYMVERYGNFVTYDPPLTPMTLILWALPIILLVMGILILLRRKSTKVSTMNTELDKEQQKRLETLLQEKE